VETRKTFSFTGERKAESREQQTILILLLSDSFLCRVMQVSGTEQVGAGDIETFRCAHFTKNGHNYSMLQIKFSGRKPSPLFAFLAALAATRPATGRKNNWNNF
jgi:hypothetical protein